MGKEGKLDSKKVVGMARAWGAYIRMLAVAVIAKQTRIIGLLNGHD